MQARERIFLEITVVGYTGRDFGMRDLHQQRAPARRQENHLPVDSPNRVFLIEESEVGFSTVFNAAHLLR
jgi:hypothetical protein